MSNPLSGLRVLDLSRILAGPWATQMLADLGAEVIKVERPGVGDDTRAWGPPYAEGENGARESAYFLGANRGKKSVAVDLKKPEGAALVRDLALKSDIMIENFKAGDMARYGLDPAALHPGNPRLIYCSITGFGQTGPRREQAGYDLMIQAMGGLMSITGQPDDSPGGGPVKVGVALVDVLTGLHAAIAILAALTERQATGKGRVIDLALFDVCAASLANQALNCLVSGRAPQRMGNQHPSIAPYQAYEASDGYMILAVGNDRQFEAFCKAAGLEDMPRDTRFATNSGRVENRDALNAVLEPALRTRSRADWITLLTAAGVPCGPINEIDEVFADPQAEARGLSATLPHTALGSAPTVANPIRLDGSPILADTAPPTLGEHTERVLMEVLGFSKEEISRLTDVGIIQR